MHIVILAWLYVTFAMALTMPSLAAGAALFAALGLGPVAIWLAIALRRARAGRERDAAARREGSPPPS